MATGNLLVEDVPYVIRGGKPLLARIYRSRDAGPAAAAVVHVHPGAWHLGDRTWGELYLEALARRGFVVVSADFRQAPENRHPDASADVATAIRWTRACSEQLGVDPHRIALVGSSSGGHLALLAACRPNATEHAGSPLRWRQDEPWPGDVDAAVAAVAALWAPVDPLARYGFAVESLAGAPPDLEQELAQIKHGTEAYFGDEETMAAAGIARIVAAGAAMQLPPAWLCHPELDRTIPLELPLALEAAWVRAGGELTLSVFAGQAHAFGHRPGPATDRLVAELADFVGGRRVA